MGYYGASAYRGDYYGQGDYYRGRGDFFDDLGSLATAALPALASAAGSAIGGPIGGMIGGVGGQMLQKALKGHAPEMGATAPGSTGTGATIPATQYTQVAVAAGGGKGLRLSYQRGGGPAFVGPPTQAQMQAQQGTNGGSGGGASSGGGGGYRRINPLNPKALRRALRRADGFKKYAKKVLRLCGEKRHIDGFKNLRKRKRAA